MNKNLKSDTLRIIWVFLCVPRFFKAPYVILMWSLTSAPHEELLLYLFSTLCGLSIGRLKNGVRQRLCPWITYCLSRETKHVLETIRILSTKFSGKLYTWKNLRINAVGDDEKQRIAWSCVKDSLWLLDLIFIKDNKKWNSVLFLWEKCLIWQFPPITIQFVLQLNIYK